MLFAGLTLGKVKSTFLMYGCSERSCNGELGLSFLSDGVITTCEGTTFTAHLLGLL